MIVWIKRWVLLAALVGHAATTWPLDETKAQSLDQTQESAGYALADALMPTRSETTFARWSCLLHWRNKETPSRS